MQQSYLTFQNLKFNVATVLPRTLATVLVRNPATVLARNSATVLASESGNGAGQNFKCF